MPFDSYAFDVIFQVLLMLNVLQPVALLLKRWAKKVEDQSSDQAAARYYFSTIFFYASYALCLFFAVVVLWIGFQYPELRHPLRSPLDLFLVKEEVSNASLRAVVSLLMSGVLVMALVPGFRKLLRERQKERRQNLKLRKDIQKASKYAARCNCEAKKWRSEKQCYEEAIALVLGSHDVPETLREKVFQLTRRQNEDGLIQR